MKHSLLVLLLFMLGGYAVTILTSGCAQIGVVAGGPQDTLPPLLIKATPDNRTVNFSGNKIVLSFNEYIEVQETQANVLISPFPKSTPTISSNLKTITIKLKDSLLPNTTYNIDFGNSVKDINEGNVYKNLSYTFSTGNYIDSLELYGKVILAETGKTDSTLRVLLYQNATDTDVRNKKPDYVAKVKADGSFHFKYLPGDNYKIYALKGGDGNKYYSSKTEVFAFYDREINVPSDSIAPVLYAYAEKKPSNNTTPVNEKKKEEKKLLYQTNLLASKQELTDSLTITFNNALQKATLDSIIITDTNYQKQITKRVAIDSTRKVISLSKDWQPGQFLCLIIPATAVEDSTGKQLSKSDTIRFNTKQTEEYGSLQLNFKNLDVSKTPVLQFIQGDAIKSQFNITSNVWMNKLMTPGEFEIRILYDTNNNGKWDPGNYQMKKQPERVIALPEKLSIKSDWSNERDLVL